MMYIFSFSFADYWPPHQTAVSQDPKNKNNNFKKTQKRKTSIHSYCAKLRILSLSSGDKDLIFHVIFSRTMESISLK